MDFLNNRGYVTCCVMVLLACCLSIAGTYLDLKVTAVNIVVVVIGLCLMVASALKEEP